LNARTTAPAHVMSVLRRACYDCHSYETRWPWYAQIPIASHLIESDVRDARGQLNWSQWPMYNAFDQADLLDKTCELASAGKMPPRRYRIVHPDARLTASEIAALCEWTQHEAARLTQGGS